MLLVDFFFFFFAFPVWNGNTDDVKYIYNVIKAHYKFYF